METGRTPLVALLVSALALVWPVAVGAPRPPGRDAVRSTVEAAPRSRGKAEGAESSPEKAGEATNGCCTPPAPKVVCAEDQITLHDATCDGAFAHFVSAAEAQRPLEPDDATKGCWTVPEGEEVERIVALLPDPIDTGMQSAFDEGIGAVIQALTAQTFLLDHFWTPWHDPHVGAEHVASCSARVPAVFTFRSCDGVGECKRLELFVVGESPTGGVRRPAVDVALRLARTGRGAKVRIIGPTFSGSAQSLKEAIEAELLEGTKKIAITTGSASAPSVKVVLQGAPKLRERVEFRAFVLSAPAVVQGFLDYVRTRSPGAGNLQDSFAVGVPRDEPTWHWFPHVALFVEDGTLFGGAFANGSRPERLASTDASCTTEDPCHAGITVKFPLHISTLRVAFSEQVDQSIGGTQSLGPIKVRSIALRPSLEATSRRDTPTSLSRETSVIEDLLLAEQTRVLAEEDVRVAGIFASDPADALFLVRHLRRRLPNARVFVFDYDLSFDHPAYAHELRGTLLMSSYPSTARADRWVFPYRESQRRSFASPISMGIYNAALAGSSLVTEWKLRRGIIGYGFPFESPAAGSASLPVLWISAIGATGSLPVGVVRPSVDGYTTAVRRVSNPVYGTTGCIELDDHNVFSGVLWTTVASLLSLLFLSFSVAACLALFGLPLPIALRWLSLFHPPPSALGPAWRWRIAALMSIAGHFLAVTTVLSLVALPRQAVHWCRTWAMSFYQPISLGVDLRILQLALLAGCVFLLGLFFPRDERGRSAAGKVTRVVVLLHVSWMLSLVWAARWVLARMQERDFLERLTSDVFNAADVPMGYLRWTSLDSQLSPVVPALVLAGLFSTTAGQYLIQARMGGKHHRTSLLWLFGLHRSRLPAEDPRSTSSRNLQAIQRLVVSCVSVWRFPFVIGLVGALFVVSVVVDPWSGRFGTMEQPLVTAVLGYGLAGAFVLTAGTVAATLTLASALGLFLVRLRHHPLAEPIRVFGTSFGSHIRLPFAALPEAAEQLRLWLTTARPVAELLPEGHVFRASVTTERVADVLRFSRGTDVVAGLRIAYQGAEARDVVPVDALALTREAWAGRRGPTVETRELARATEDLVAAHTLLFILWAIRQLRTMAGFSIASSLLLALAVTSYPFEPARVLATVTAVFVVLTLGASLVVFVVLERDALLSEIAGTAKDRIEWNSSFLQQVVAWVVVPFLAFLATQYPEEVRALFGWASPYLPSQ